MEVLYNNTKESFQGVSGPTGYDLSVTPAEGIYRPGQPRIFLTVPHKSHFVLHRTFVFGKSYETKSIHVQILLPCTDGQPGGKNYFRFRSKKYQPTNTTSNPTSHTKKQFYLSLGWSRVCVVWCVAYICWYEEGQEPNPRYHPCLNLCLFLAHSRMESMQSSRRCCGNEMVVVGSSSTPILPVVISSSSTTLKRPCSFFLPHRSEKKAEGEEEMEPSPVSDVRSTTSPSIVLTTTSDTIHQQQQQEEHPHQDKKARCLPLSFSHTTVVSSSDEDEEEEEEDHVVDETAPPTTPTPRRNTMGSTNASTNTNANAKNTHHLLLQNKYDPVNVAVMSKLELSLWRKQQRKQRNRISAAKSRQSQKLRIVELEDEVADWQRRVALLQEQIQDHKKKNKNTTTLSLQEEEGESNKSSNGVGGGGGSMTTSITREEAPVVVLSTNMAATTTTVTTLPTDTLEPNPNAWRISPKKDMVSSFHHDSTVMTPKDTTTSNSSCSSSNSIDPVSSTSSSSTNSSTSSSSSSLASLFKLLPTVPPSKMISRQALSRLINPFTP
jgi:Basic region leucine zipper